MKYNFNLKYLIFTSLPIAIRGLATNSQLLELFYILCKPILDLYSKFKDFKGNVPCKMEYNAQYPCLQRLLNDNFDTTLRRIKVYDALHAGTTLIYPDGTKNGTPNNQNCTLTTFLVYPDCNQNAGFTVELPNSIYNDQKIKNQIISLVNIYKFAGTHYKVINTIINT